MASSVDELKKLPAVREATYKAECAIAEAMADALFAELLERHEKFRNMSYEVFMAKLDEATAENEAAHRTRCHEDGMDHTTCTAASCSYMYGVEHLRKLAREKMWHTTLTVDEIYAIFAERIKDEL